MSQAQSPLPAWAERLSPWHVLGLWAVLLYGMVETYAVVAAFGERHFLACTGLFWAFGGGAILCFERALRNNTSYAPFRWLGLLALLAAAVATMGAYESDMLGPEALLGYWSLLLAWPVYGYGGAFLCSVFVVVPYFAICALLLREPETAALPKTGEPFQHSRLGI